MAGLAISMQDPRWDAAQSQGMGTRTRNGTVKKVRDNGGKNGKARLVLYPGDGLKEVMGTPDSQDFL